MQSFTKKWRLLLLSLFFPALVQAQVQHQAPTGPLTLEQCIDFALANDPNVKQALLDEQIGDRQIKSSLSSWLPQISASYALSHNFKLGQTAFGDQIIQIGRENNSNVLLQATQTIYDNDVLLASKAARFRRLQLDQNTGLNKINTVVDVSKAYYDILLTREQLMILDENIVRQEKQYNDAYARFETGLVDKTDYQRASITLANTRADRKRTQESLKAKYAFLKQLMGFPAEKALSINRDTAQLVQQALLVDTVQVLQLSNRIEFQQLQTETELQRLNTSFYKWEFLPTVSTYINYNWQYLNNNFSELYSTAYPTSGAGLQVSLPIFTGGRRFQNIKIAQLQEQRLEVEQSNLQNIINTEYERALANYKSDYNEWLTLKRNAEVAREVYDIIKLQYDEGIKAYIDLIVAESELNTAQLNYYNALYNVLASKLDYQRALGNINISQ